MADTPDLSWSIEKRAPDHDGSGFDCGRKPLNDFLRRYAGQNERVGFSQSFVAVRRGQRRVEGYYTVHDN